MTRQGLIKRESRSRSMASIPIVQYLGRRRCYVDGAFALSDRPRELFIEIRRGLETLPLQSKVDLTQNPSQLTGAALPAFGKGLFFVLPSFL